MHQQARTHAGFSRSNLRIGHEPLCPGTATTTGAWGSRGAITPLRLPASRRWTHFGEVDRVSLRQFYGWSANRRAKLCVSTFPCVHSHSARLRNVAMTAPYFHNGSVVTLQEAVRVMARVQLGVTLGDAETSGIVAFLESLTGELPANFATVPTLPAGSVTSPRESGKETAR